MKDSLLYKIVRPLLIITIKLYRPTIINNEVIPEGRVILAGNHKSNLDPLLVGLSTKRCVHFLAKDELIKGPFGFAFKKMGIIPVNRREKDRKSLETAINCLKNDLMIGIFPEGTFNNSSEIIMPFKYGAVKMAKETDSFIIPFSIINDYKIFRKSVKIIFGEPYKVKGDLTFENEILMKKVEKLIKENREVV